MTATTSTERRELASRTSDGIEVTLLWTQTTNQVSIVVWDSHMDETLEFDVAGRDALDAFNHPYAHAAIRRCATLATPCRPTV